MFQCFCQLYCFNDDNGTVGIKVSLVSVSLFVVCLGAD